MGDTHILDPLWITKGSSGLDPEYSKYILLAANKKYRDKQDIINITEIGDEYIIIEPKSLKITDSSGKAIVIKI